MVPVELLAPESQHPLALLSGCGDGPAPVLHIERGSRHCEQRFRRSLDIGDPLTGRAAMQRGHVAMSRVERNLVETRPFGPNMVRVESGFMGERQQRAFHRIAGDEPASTLMTEARIVAQDRAPEQRQCGGNRGGVFVGSLQYAFGRVARASYRDAVIARVDAARHHLVAGQRARLVGADDRCRTQCLDGGQFADHRLSCRHPSDADRHGDGDDGRQSFRNDADGERDHGDQRVGPGEITDQHGEREQQHRRREHDPGEAPREPFDLEQQRRGQRFDAAEQRRDPADLGADPGLDRQCCRLPGGDQRARKSHVAAVAERGVVCHLDIVFGDRDRFSREDRLVDEQPARADQTEVGGHSIARLQHDDITGNENTHRDARPGAIANHGRARRNHAADRIERALGLALLNKADKGIDEHDRKDDAGIDEMPQHDRRERCGEQEIDQCAVKMRKEAEQRVADGGCRERIGTVARQPFGGLLSRQPVDRRIERRQGQLLGPRVPVSCRLRRHGEHLLVLGRWAMIGR